ncbi:hypothetical protein CDAR_13081 [Caerostris darwini]|uniref:Uncharacterized protein n=1 Tax=Caerostris darwini TaxID=1538125 RepID=A0AAV4Q891_9ARAC|nr:hypothetical protein CDAR_13081 [Caerostris darwini]
MCGWHGVGNPALQRRPIVLAGMRPVWEPLKYSREHDEKQSLIFRRNSFLLVTVRRTPRFTAPLFFQTVDAKLLAKALSGPFPAMSRGGMHAPVRNTRLRAHPLFTLNWQKSIENLLPRRYLKVMWL